MLIYGKEVNFPWCIHIHLEDQLQVIVIIDLFIVFTLYK